MTINCTKGMWQLKPETGEIFSLDREARAPIATVSGLSFPDKDIENCAANAAVISNAATMYSLLIFIKSGLQLMYRDCPELKGSILNYVEERISHIEANVERLAAYRPYNVDDKR